MLEEVKNRAIKALEQNTVSEEVYNDEYTARKQAEYELWKIKEQQPCEDCVSRQMIRFKMAEIPKYAECKKIASTRHLKEFLEKEQEEPIEITPEICKGFTLALEYLRDFIIALPLVTPTRKAPREDITEDEVRINMLELALNQAKEHAESIEVLTDNHRLIFKAEKRGSEND